MTFRIGRRDFITLLGGAAIAWPVGARAQQPDRVRLIGVLMGIAETAEGRSRVLALQQGLQRLGWIDGRNVRFEVRWAGGDADRMRTYSAELARLAPDVILVNGTQASSILLHEVHSVPVVFVQVSDPITSGLVTSLARPGGNATGFNSNEDAMLGKWLELLKEIVPRVTRVAFIFNPGDPAWEGYLHAGQSVAPTLHIQLIPTAVRDAADIERTIDAFAREPDGGLIVQPTAITTVHRELIVARAAQHRLPAVYPLRSFATSGGLASYGVENIDLYRRAASYVDRILKGERPSDLPVQQPTNFELVINLKTAKALGLDVPWILQQRADEVIE
jgi:putative ABC transport system substrate-binding protein